MIDYDRDGNTDRKDYYNSLGGAYYFRPPGLDAPVSPFSGCLLRFIEGLVLIVLGTILYLIF